MATKAQLKQYFETGKIPTQAQFGDLIDSIFNIINSPNNSLDINSDNNNIKLSIKNYRNVQGLYNSQISMSLHLFLITILKIVENQFQYLSYKVILIIYLIMLIVPLNMQFQMLPYLNLCRMII